MTPKFGPRAPSVIANFRASIALLAGWQPDGAVWYAHACCGAGTDGRSSFSSVFDPGSALDRMVTELAELGSLVAPLPVALLTAPKPLRAFIGHVEPTFDWTIRHLPSRHALTADLVSGLYSQMMLGRPVGWAFTDFHVRAGADPPSTTTRDWPCSPARPSRTPHCAPG